MMSYDADSDGVKRDVSHDKLSGLNDGRKSFNNAA